MNLLGLNSWGISDLPWETISRSVCEHVRMCACKQKAPIASQEEDPNWSQTGQPLDRQKASLVWGTHFMTLCFRSLGEWQLPFSERSQWIENHSNPAQATLLSNGLTAPTLQEWKWGVTSLGKPQIQLMCCLTAKGIWKRQWKAAISTTHCYVTDYSKGCNYHE